MYSSSFTRSCLSLSVAFLLVVAGCSRSRPVCGPAMPPTQSLIGLRPVAPMGLVLVIRHAITHPETADAKVVDFDDPTTQRRLNDAGRKQAQELGAFLRQEAMEPIMVFSSPYERCEETASLSACRENIRVMELATFHQESEAVKAERMGALDNLMGREYGQDRVALVVTHRDFIESLGQRVPNEGEGYLFAAGGDKEPLARLLSSPYRFEQMR